MALFYVYVYKDMREGREGEEFVVYAESRKEGDRTYKKACEELKMKPGEFIRRDRW